ncbi:hypothetical protein HN011_007408 [Eciton burchellii]|nr:hypothetical protein HN011_007408 [Eciton burchellii]
MQMMNKIFGGSVTRRECREDVQFLIEGDTKCLSGKGLHKKQPVLLTHGDSINRVADSFRTTARSSSFITSIASDKMNFYGMQLHPELDLTPKGKLMLHNILLGIAGNYTLRDRESQCMQYIRNTVSDKKVLLLVSGVLDSERSLVTEILSKDQVIALHINNGFMQGEETQFVEQSLTHLCVLFGVVNAACCFMQGATTVPLDDIASMVNANVTNNKGICGAASSPRAR